MQHVFSTDFGLIRLHNLPCPATYTQYTRVQKCTTEMQITGVIYIIQF